MLLLLHKTLKGSRNIQVHKTVLIRAVLLNFEFHLKNSAELIDLLPVSRDTHAQNGARYENTIRPHYRIGSLQDQNTNDNL